MPFLQLKRRTVLKQLGSGVLAIALSASMALAAMGDKLTVNTGNFHQKRTYWVDSHQDITIDFRLGADGKGHFHSRYSNGKRLDGDHFYAKVILLDANNQQVAVGIAGVGLNATYGGGTNVAYRDIAFNLPAEYRKSVKSVRFEAGHSDAVDDKKFWQSAKSVADIVFGTSVGGFAVLGSNGGTDLKPLIFQ